MRLSVVQVKKKREREEVTGLKGCRVTRLCKEIGYYYEKILLWLRLFPPLSPFGICNPITNEPINSMAMTDNIKIFIEQHRNDFDGAIPGAHAWESVSQTLSRLQTADGMERAILLDRVLLDTETPAASVWAAVEKALDTAGRAKLDTRRWS